MVVVMHNQVINGGFHQYFTNGYGQFAEETIEALFQISAPKTADLLAQALILVKKDYASSEAFRKDLLDFKIPALFDKDDLFDPLEELDDIYYSNKFGEDIEVLLTKFLSSDDQQSNQ